MRNIQIIKPEKLRSGDMIRVIAPSLSNAIISQENRQIANQRFDELGLCLSFGKHVEEKDLFNSSDIESRIEDLHDAFRDKKVNAIITVIGGFNCNQLLRYIDWDLIRNNPKIFCGYSDITALQNAMYAKTGLMTYSGPHYSSFGQKLYFEYTFEYFKKCLFSEEPFDILPSPTWTDDQWYKDQENRRLNDSDDYLVINEGQAQGIILGPNLCTFNLLHGTEYFPDLADSILFIEDDHDTKPHTFDRDLQSLLHQPGFGGVKGIVIGRFQNASEMTNEKLVQIIKTKKELDTIPVVANVDFGHTSPMITFPIGGKARINATKDAVQITIEEH